MNAHKHRHRERQMKRGTEREGDRELERQRREIDRHGETTGGLVIEAEKDTIMAHVFD